MATLNSKVQLRLRWFGRWTLKAATFGRRFGFAIPHRLVTAVTNRAWQMKLGEADWRSIRINNLGQVIG
ncbi:MAG: hypothetical protein QM754_07040 [Tepidisphaeraceae bacterium]